MFKFIKKIFTNPGPDIKDPKVTFFDLELTAVVIAYEIARSDGEITADEVTIAGIVIGNVRAESIKLSKQADVNGDLCCSSIAIEEGARIEASLSKDQVQNG